MRTHPDGVDTEDRNRRALPNRSTSSLHRLLLVIVGLAALVIAAGAGSGLVGAQAGVGIDPGEIAGLPPLAGGESVSVAMQVRNPGTEGASYEMIAQPLAGEVELQPDPTWFTFEPQTFDLDGGEAVEVQMTIAPPDGTDAGDYLALATAQLVLPEAEGSGAQVGAAVATKVYFTMSPPESSDGGVPVWAIGAAAGVVVLGVIVFAVKRSGVSISINRKT